MARKRLAPIDRKHEILRAALIVCQRPGGWSKLTRDSVAREANCAEGLISKYFGTMVAFRRSIMRAALVESNLSIVAQGLASGDITALKADDNLKHQAIATLVR